MRSALRSSPESVHAMPTCRSPGRADAKSAIGRSPIPQRSLTFGPSSHTRRVVNQTRLSPERRPRESTPGTACSHLRGPCGPGRVGASFLHRYRGSAAHLSNPPPELPQPLHVGKQALVEVRQGLNILKEPHSWRTGRPKQGKFTGRMTSILPPARRLSFAAGAKYSTFKILRPLAPPV